MKDDSFRELLYNSFCFDTLDITKNPEVWELNDRPYSRLDKSCLDVRLGYARYADNFISKEDCNWLLEVFNKRELKPVGVDGYNTDNDLLIGSVRSTAWAPNYAKILTKKFLHFGIHRNESILGSTLDEYSSTDNFDLDGTVYRRAKFLGASPFMRFMKYKEGGYHRTHYDAAFIHPKNKQVRTLCSWVLFLNDVTSEEGGKLRFIDDDQWYIKTSERCFDDYKVDTDPKKVLASVQPKAGTVVVFDHRLPHDVELFVGSERNIIRGDLFFYVS